MWQGALGLANYLLNRQHLLRGSTVLELGCGPGLTGLVAALSASTVYFTDCEHAVLANCQAGRCCAPGGVSEAAALAHVMCHAGQRDSQCT